MAYTLFPPFETPSLAHPRRRQAERDFGLGRFQRITWSAEGPIGACRATVANAVTVHGGNPVPGWQIHVWPNLFFEALAHYVWRAPSGELVDLTSKYPSDRARHTVFIPSCDPAFCDSLHSRYYILHHAPEVHVLIDASRRQDEKRRMIEDAIRHRLTSGTGHVCRWLDHANAEEKAQLEADELWIGVAIRACEALSAVRISRGRGPLSAQLPARASTTAGRTTR